jgi:hypothetical protein
MTTIYHRKLDNFLAFPQIYISKFNLKPPLSIIIFQPTLYITVSKSLKVGKFLHLFQNLLWINFVICLREGAGVENSDTQYLALHWKEFTQQNTRLYFTRQIKIVCAAVLSYPPAVTLPVNVLRLWQPVLGIQPINIGTSQYGAEKILGKSSLVTGLEWHRGFHEVKVPRFRDNYTGWW